MREVTGDTKVLTIIGDPVSHSFSPVMHNYISQKLGMDYVYTALNVKKNDLKAAIEGIRALGIAGANITSPHKFEALALMDELSDKARRFGSVNTLVNKNGKLSGFNTDADGFYRSLIRSGANIEKSDILFIGAGGATKPVITLFADKGAKSISIINRTEEKARDICRHVKGVSGYDVEIGDKKKHYDIVINTTTLGMHPYEDQCPVSEMPYADEGTLAADMIYNPEETLFLKMAKKRGAKTVNGLGMLIYQGMIAYELFTGAKLDDGIYDELLINVFKK